MYLHCFGKLELEGSTDLSPQVLLVLSYLHLEGLESKTEVAELFWPKLSREFSKRGERKDLNNLAVTLAALRRKAALDVDLIADLTSDVKAFLTAFEAADYQAASKHYVGDFLLGIEHKARLNLGADLYLWLLNKRHSLSEKAAFCFLTISKRQNLNLEDALALSQKIIKLLNEDSPYAYLAELLEFQNQMGLKDHPELSGLVIASLSEPRLSKLAKRFFLTLSLQKNHNLTATRLAVGLSPYQATKMFEELETQSLTINHVVKHKAIANAYLEQHASEKLELLIALQKHSTAEESFDLYQQTYQLTASFGGLGFFSAAREAYTVQAKIYLKEQRFTDALSVLEEFSQAEFNHQLTPDPHLRFIYAYTLARIAHYKEGLRSLKGVEETAEVKSIKAGLNLALGNPDIADELAREVLALDSRRLDWAKAIAANTVGSLQHHQANLHESEAYYAKAALHFQLADMPFRASGMMMNRANIFLDMGDVDKAKAIHLDLLKSSPITPILKIRILGSLGLIALIEQDLRTAFAYFDKSIKTSLEYNLDKEQKGVYGPALSAWSLVGFYAQQISKQDALMHLDEASVYARETGNRKEHAKILVHKALVLKDISEFEEAWLILKKQAGEKESNIYLPVYKDLLDEQLAKARLNNDQEGIERYLSKLSGLLESQQSIPLKPF